MLGIEQIEEFGIGQNEEDGILKINQSSVGLC